MSWKARHYRIFPLIRAFGLDPDAALDRIAAIAELPAPEEVTHPQHETGFDPRTTADDEPWDPWLTESDEPERERAPRDSVGAMRSIPNRALTDLDDCPCDGCGLRRPKDRRRS
jgi:hypothetical protein